MIFKFAFHVLIFCLLLINSNQGLLYPYSSKSNSLYVLTVSAHEESASEIQQLEIVVDIKMPLMTHPLSDDEYCNMNYPLLDILAEYNIRGPWHVIGFIPIPSENAHHMMLYSCTSQPTQTKQMGKSKDVDACNDDLGYSNPCRGGGQAISMVWANGGEMFFFPPDTGVNININQLYGFGLTVHYKDGVSDPLSSKFKDQSGFQLVLRRGNAQYDANVKLLVPSGYFELPPNKKQVIIKGQSQCATSDMLVFAVRVHAHTRGVANRFSVRRNVNNPNDASPCIDGKDMTSWDVVITYERSTQDPQSFVPLPNGPVLIRKGDSISYECEFDTTKETRHIREGSTHNDEMCNIYLQYRRWNEEEEMEKVKEINNRISQSQKRLKAYTDGEKNKSPNTPKKDAIIYDIEWTNKANANFNPKNSYQVAGVGVGKNVVWVFHRGSRIWDQNSFDWNNALSSKEKAKGPTNEDVIVGLDPITANVIYTFGKGLFYFPHSITEDPLGNGVWITDVGLHQVLLLSVPSGKIIRSFGVPLEPGNDAKHFCKPTHIAFSTDNKYIYITDGYCNTRVLKFSYETGEFIKEWGHSGSGVGAFFVPHAVAVHRVNVESNCGLYGKDIIFICDRENYRIQIFDEEGTHLKTLENIPLGRTKPYSVQIMNNGEGQIPTFFSGVRYSQSRAELIGRSLSDGKKDCNILQKDSKWLKSSDDNINLQEPHMIDVDNARSFVYVAEVIDGSHGGKLYRFRYS